MHVDDTVMHNAETLLLKLAISPDALDNELTFIMAVRKGLSGKSARIAADVFGSRSVIIKALHVDPSNLSRTLSQAQSEALLDAVRAFSEAQATLDTEEKARKWLNTSSKALGGEIPVNLFDTFEGRNWVRQVLRKIQSGDFS